MKNPDTLVGRNLSFAVMRARGEESNICRRYDICLGFCEELLEEMRVGLMIEGNPEGWVISVRDGPGALTLTGHESLPAAICRSYLSWKGS